MNPNFKKLFKKLVQGAAIAGLVAATGCTHAVRVRTAGYWATPSASGQGIAVHYFAYWEGQCGGYRNMVPYMTRCAAGNGHIKRCTVNADNTVQCADEAALEPLLKTNDGQ